MPKILDRLIGHLKDKGFGEQHAYATAVRTLQNAGELNQHGELTVKGQKRDAMGVKGRAKDRAARPGKRV